MKSFLLVLPVVVVLTVNRARSEIDVAEVFARHTTSLHCKCQVIVAAYRTMCGEAPTSLRVIVGVAVDVVFVDFDGNLFTPCVALLPFV